MRGHVTQRKGSKTWAYVYDEPPGEDGKRVQRWRGGYATKREADDALTKTLNGIVENTYISPEKLTVRQFIEDVWLPVKRTQVRQTTIATYERTLNKHVLPKIGRVNLQRLTPMHLDRLYADLGKGDDALSANTVRLVAAIISSSLKFAKKKRLVPVNVVELSDIPSATRRTVRVLTPEQTHVFLEHVRGERLAALWRFLALTGVRRGEALGLTWYSVDLDEATCRIERQLVPIGSTLVFLPPKTESGERTLRLDPGTVAVLRLHKDAQDLERQAWGEAYEDGGLVFSRENGTPLDPRGVSQAFQVRRKAAGLPYARLHSLRHGVGTHLALKIGAHRETVRDVLGHASITTTETYYTHAIDDVTREAIESHADLIDGDAR